MGKLPSNDGGGAQPSLTLACIAAVSAAGVGALLLRTVLFPNNIAALVICGLGIGGCVRLAGQGRARAFGILAAASMCIATVLAFVSRPVTISDLQALRLQDPTAFEVLLKKIRYGIVLGWELNRWIEVLAAGVSAAISYRIAWTRSSNTTEQEDFVQASEPTLVAASSVHQHRRYFLAWCIVWLLCLLASLRWTTGELCPWVRMTQPASASSSANTLLGFTDIYGGQPLMREDESGIYQTRWFSGTPMATTSFRFLRAVHPWVASYFLPLLGPVDSLLFVNIIVWWGCAYLTWRLANSLSGDPLAGFLGAAFVSLGMGFITHLTDHGPHVLSFGVYYAGLSLLIRSGIAERARPWATHLLLAMVVGACAVAYNTSQMLLGLYLAVAWRHNRLRHWLAMVAIALAVRPAWRWILAGLFSRVQDVESEYLARALRYWIDLPGSGVMGWLDAASKLSECLFFFDSPLIVLLGLAVCMTIPGKRFLGLAAVAMPVLAAWAFSPSAGARGYIVFGATAWIYVALAARLASGLRSASLFRRVLSVSLVIVLLTGQAAWAFAHVTGRLGPVQTFFLGWDDGLGNLQQGAAQVVSLTGHEPTPKLFGGAASLVDAGVVVQPQTVAAPRGLLVWSWATRLPILLWITATAYAAWPALRDRYRTTIIAGTLWIAGGIASALANDRAPVFFSVAGAVAVSAKSEARLDIEVSAACVKELQERMERSPQNFLDIHLSNNDGSPDSPLNIELRAGNEPVEILARPAGSWRVIDPQSFLRHLANSRSLTVQLKNRGDQPVFVSGWQRLGLPGRVWTVVNGQVDARALPALELRCIKPDGTLEFAAF